MKKAGRNDPCPCGSGKKYKQCCMQRDEAAARNAPAQPAARELLQLGFSHHMAGRLAEAEQIYRQILKTEPRNADALHLLGIVAGDRDDHDAAIELIRKAISIDPADHSYHSNLGRMLNRKGDAAAAEIAYRRAVALKHDGAHLNDLANTQAAQRKFIEAADNYRRAIAANPGLAEPHEGLANVLFQQGRIDEAIAGYRQALTLFPNLAELHANLGAALKIQGRNMEAIASYRQAILLNPNSATTHTNLGSAYQALGDLDAAIESFRRALALEPDYSQLRDRAAIDWHIRESVQDTLLYTMSICASSTPAQYLEEARRYTAKLMAVAKPYTTWPACQEIADGLPLRVGLVSSDFRSHPVGFFLESIVAHRHPQRIDLIAYSVVPDEDALTARIRPNFKEWHSLVGLDTETAAGKIRDNGIHILVDLNGYTANNRLPIFAWKPAPVQVSWLGYWASTALPTIDYVLCDPHSIPADEAAQFTERVWPLPETRLCFTAPGENIPVGELPAVANGYITFGCFNNPTKLNDRVVALWARLLLRIEGSRLVLKGKLFDDASTRELMLQRFAENGVAADRLELQGMSPRAEYLAAFNRIDIALDPFPYTGATTSIEGLWMGVPLITKRGDRMIAHQGESILHNLDMADWIAGDEGATIDLAIAHTRDIARLAGLRRELRQRLLQSPLCDAPRFARHLEAAWRELWERHAMEKRAIPIQ
jgi:predicted O-linked N-acetylglucosamine transferase (SPINDLY family)